MAVCGQLHAPAVLSGIAPPVTLRYTGDWWTSEAVWAVWEREILSLPGIETSLSTRSHSLLFLSYLAYRFTVATVRYEIHTALKSNLGLLL